MGTSTQLTLVAAVRASGNVALVIPLPLWVGQAAVDPSPIPVWLRLCTHSKFDGGQPDAGCLTPQLRTNGRLADGKTTAITGLVRPRRPAARAYALPSPTWRQRFELARFDLTDQPLASFDSSCTSTTGGSNPRPTDYAVLSGVC